jgi:hypothetical protein
MFVRKFQNIVFKNNKNLKINIAIFDKYKCNGKIESDKKRWRNGY